jgi:hypothetical protein
MSVRIRNQGKIIRADTENFVEFAKFDTFSDVDSFQLLDLRLDIDETVTISPASFNMSTISDIYVSTDQYVTVTINSADFDLDSSGIIMMRGVSITDDIVIENTLTTIASVKVLFGGS